MCGNLSHKSVSVWCVCVCLFNVCVFNALTLLGFRGAWRHFLVGVDRGLRRQAVELFPADQVDLLEVLHLLLQKGGKT